MVLCKLPVPGRPTNLDKNRKENPQKLTQLSSRSHPRNLVGKRTAQKDITIDTTSDSQVNSNFPNRWSPATTLAVGAGGGCLDIFSLIYHFSFLSPSL